MTQPHPEGYHRDEAARQRCWACSGSGKLDISENDWGHAQLLIVQGWKSTSNKYRHIARSVNLAFDAYVTLAPNTPKTLQTALRDAWRRANDYRLRVHNADDPTVETLTLTVGQFRAFKALGGDMA